eukprot:CAMPEP_0194218736 /NCGR_PEP_ID=MMETSP0156-20130528/24481_1 /TAXON_ID=33649 /ORGANISM="Thalassionema nitzschioides, Strain L26-B" /LENGTH=1350 /DNA_ID=CAMNT_0038948201 /DNA_START=8 /DNA_END=4060 /DNA_ORIENTATION=+
MTVTDNNVRMNIVSVQSAKHDNVHKRIELPRPMSSARIRPSENRHVGHQRPRSISTGRIVGDRSLARDDDATSVTKAILELRDKREKSRSRRRTLKHHPLHSSQSYSCSDDLPPKTRQPRSSQDNAPNEITAIKLKRSATIDSSISLSEGEQAATLKLKEAEDRIGSLMQDLEELRFFHEIDMESSSNPLPTKLVAGVPRGSSPASPSQRFLSPRRLSSMDRNSLELETQQLQRKIEILQQEKYDLNINAHKSHSEDKARMLSLEKSLIDIRKTIIGEMKKIHQGRIELSEEFDVKLAVVNSKNAQMRKEANAMTAELEFSKKIFENMREEYSHFREKAKKKTEDLQRKWGAKKFDYESQLDEITNVLDETQQTLASRDEDVERLQNDLIQYKLEEDLYKKKLADSLSTNTEVEKLLQEGEDLYTDLEDRHKETLSVLDFKTQRINSLEETIQQQAEKLESVQKALDDIEVTHKEKVEELKRSFDLQQQRRLDDLVESQHAKTIDYEERLTDIRKQLNLATERYHTEIEQKATEMRQNLDKVAQDAKEEVKSEYESKLAALQESIDALQKRYDDSRAETLKYQTSLESKDRESIRETERQNALHKRKIECLNDKLDRTLREVGEREGKIRSLSDRLSESEERCILLLQDMETQQTDDSKTRDDLILQRKSVSKLRSEISRKEFEIAEIRHEMETEVEKMKNEMEEIKRRENSSEDKTKLRLDELRLALEGARKELIAEKSRHESLESELRGEIAKLDGKLSATESTLREKRSTVESLELRLASASQASSNSCTVLNATIADLTRELDNYKEYIREQESLNQQKDDDIKKLESDLEASRQSSFAQITSLEEMLALSQISIDQLTNDSTSNNAVDEKQELASLQEQFTITAKSNNSKIDELEKSLSSSQSRVAELDEALRHAEGKVIEFEKAFVYTQKELKDAEKENAISLDELSSLRSAEEKLRTNIKVLSAEKEESSIETKIQLESYKVKLALMENQLKEKKEEAIQSGLEVENLKIASEEESNELKVEINKLKLLLRDVTNEDCALTNGMAEQLQHRIKELENELESLRLSNSEVCDSPLAIEQLKQKLVEKESEQTEMEKTLKQALYERAQAMQGLEQMIEEVQIRQDEYDALSDILETRDEELESAKMIATKALASAQEIKARYKEKGALESSRQTDLQLEIDELTASIEYLTGKNDKLRTKSKRLEMELHGKNKECAKLRDDVRDYETKSTQGSSFNSSISTDKDGFMPLGKFQNEPDGMMTAMTENAFSISDEQSNSSSSNPVMDSSLNKTEYIGEATKWLQDFEDSKSAFSNEDSTINSCQENKRSAARDSVRKRSRKRYSKLK